MNCKNKMSPLLKEKVMANQKSKALIQAKTIQSNKFKAFNTGKTTTYSDITIRSPLQINETNWLTVPLLRSLPTYTMLEYPKKLQPTSQLMTNFSLLKTAYQFHTKDFIRSTITHKSAQSWTLMTNRGKAKTQSN